MRPPRQFPFGLCAFLLLWPLLASAQGTPTLQITSGPQYSSLIGPTCIPLTASGGNGTYAWSLWPGSSLPPGISIRTDLPLNFSQSWCNTNTGTGLAGVPTTPGTYSFRLEVSSGTLSVTQDATMSIASRGLMMKYIGQPDAFVNTPYSYTLGAFNNVGTVTWSLDTAQSPDGDLPPGMTLSSAGVLSGTPTTAGDYWSHIYMADSRPGRVQISFWIKVFAIHITTPTVLPNATAGAAYNTFLSATGGSGSYSFTADCCLPRGLVLGSSGTISGFVASDEWPGDYTFRVTASDGTNSHTKLMSIRVITSPPTLPFLYRGAPPYEGHIDDCTLGAACEALFRVFSGGAAPFTWTVTGLPPGMFFTNPDIYIPNITRIWGIPLVAGTYNIRVMVTDSQGVSTSQIFSLHVSTLFTTSQASSPDSRQLPNGTMGVGYSHVLKVIGGQPGYGVALVGGRLPAGLSLNADQFLINGTPAESGYFFPVFKFHDWALGDTLLATPPLPIAGPPGSTISFVSLSDLGSTTPGIPYSVQLLAWGAASLTWSLAPNSGPLPSGLTLSSSGLLSGTPATMGTYQFLVTAVDSSNAANYAVRQFTLNVTPLAITIPSLPSGILNSNYSATLAATGGSGTLTWALTPFSGLLPPGLTLASNGAITGTPTSMGQYNFYITVTDTANNAVTKSFNISILAAGTAATTYLVGDAAPLLTDLNGDGDRDDAGEFGDGVLNNLDLIQALRAVVNLSRPPSCSDRFDSMDAAPADATTRGGDTLLNNLDLIRTLRRVVNLDTSRPQRASRGISPCQ